MTNKVSPKALLQSKWTKVEVNNKKEKHFIITKVEFNEDQQVINCVIEAVMTKHEYAINWRDLKESNIWLMGWR
ncbi:TIGR02450 family Trp-rich protein [Colwellia sp. RSH04]|uniref:TIGR02450 family Trp-rich protein n=1 Tax=Colwellia sp. RSH04 TaxID=2305464 RepID=UPI000E586227|nr:TIGR02450 family Trp-rich protein [Colwellia sp. RSH04]RHW77887.1 TIGR02450 family Trp-rich protein [Colwellia sp. RSH04]